MTDSLSSILSHKGFNEPSEMVAIKRYVQDHFQVAVEVMIRGGVIIVTSPSAALTSTLRFQSLQLQKVARTDKRIVLRTK